MSCIKSIYSNTQQVSSKLVNAVFNLAPKIIFFYSNICDRCGGVRSHDLPTDVDVLELKVCS